MNEVAIKLALYRAAEYMDRIFPGESLERRMKVLLFAAKQELLQSAMSETDLIKMTNKVEDVSKAYKDVFIQS